MEFTYGGEATPEQLAQMRAQVARMRARERVVPVAWPLSGLLALSDKAAVALTGALIFQRSARIQVRTVLRHEQPHAFAGAVLRPAVPGRRLESAEQVLRFGVRFHDGRTATNTDETSPLGLPGFDDGGQLSLRPGRGGGGSGVYEQELLLSAVPPDGPLTFFIAWPAFDISETRVEFDATGMTSAADQVLELWPEEEPEQLDPRPPRFRLGQPEEGAFFKPILGFDD